MARVGRSWIELQFFFRGSFRGVESAQYYEGLKNLNRVVRYPNPN